MDAVSARFSVSVTFAKYYSKLQNVICFANVGYSPTPRQHF